MLRWTVAFVAAAVSCLGQNAVDRAEPLLQAGQFEQAEAILQEGVRKEPGNAEARYRLGFAQYRQGKLAPARANLLTVVKAAPPAHYSRYFLGRIALAENKPAEAVSWLEPVASAPETVFDAPAQLAGAFAASGQIQKSIAPLQRAIAQAPWEASLYYRLGQALQKTGQPELARDALETSTRLRNATREDVETLMAVSRAISAGDAATADRLSAPLLGRAGADPNALVALGVIQGSGNRHGEAIRAFELAAARDPASFQAQYNRGLAMMKSGRTAEAIAPLETAVKLLPQSADANAALGLALFSIERAADAVEPLERAWSKDSSKTRVGALLAMACLRSGSGAKAIPVLEQLIRSNPGEASSYVLLTQALGDDARAVTVALDARKRFPDDPQAQMAAGQALARAGRYQEARPSFEAVLRVRPGEPYASLGLAESLQKAGSHADALRLYEAALSEPKTELAARLGMARSLVAARQVEKARSVLEAAFPKHEADATLHLDLSRVYARLGLDGLAAERAKSAEQLRAAQGTRQ